VSQANFVATGPSGISSLTTAPPPPTSPLPFGYTPADYANDLTQLIKTLGLTNVWLVGHSLGGSIALWAADLMPQAVRGVICVNAGGGIYLKEEFERFRMAGQQLVKLRPWWLCHLPFVDVMMACMNVARPVPRAWGRQRVLDWTLAEPEAALRALLDSTTADEVHRLPQVVSRLQQPVYFLAGDRDTVMEPQYVRHLASFHHSFACRGENVVEIANCGHLAMLEQPEAVARQILQWVGQHTTPPQMA
jgi:pimeloyl-ACP methyl ester carboxylesterase